MNLTRQAITGRAPVCMLSFIAILWLCAAGGAFAIEGCITQAIVKYVGCVGGTMTVNGVTTNYGGELPIALASSCTNCGSDATKIFSVERFGCAHPCGGGDVVKLTIWCNNADPGPHSVYFAMPAGTNGYACVEASWCAFASCNESTCAPDGCMLTKTSCEAPDSPEGGDAPRGDGVWLTADMFKRGEKLYFDGVLIWPLDEEPGEIVHRWAANDVRNEIPRPPKDTMYPDGGMWLTRDMLVPGETLYYNGIRIWPAKPLPGETIHKSSSQK